MLYGQRHDARHPEGAYEIDVNASPSPPHSSLLTKKQTMQTSMQIEKVLDLAVLIKASFYGDASQLSPHELKEATASARGQFSKIVQDETERLEKLAEQENTRLIKNLIEREENDSCPICLEDFYPNLSFEMRHKEPSLMLCCGNYCCEECTGELLKFHSHGQEDPSRELLCPCCRAPCESNNFKINLKAANSSKKWLLRPAADAFASGKMGLPKSKKKALEYYQKAAEWGDASAQRELAVRYMNGIRGLPQSMSLATKWAEQAVEQGDAIAQGILGEILLHGPNYTDCERKRGYDLISLAAYQGDPISRMLLVQFYTSKLPEDLENIDLRQNKDCILSGYWCGKAAEIDSKDPRTRVFALEGLVRCLLQNVRDTAWHEDRPSIGIDPLTGYSHVPFCVWALSNAEKMLPDVERGDEFNVLSVWKFVCANCGSRDKSKLNVCHGCNAFSYCSKECQVKHWNDGHKVDCKGHWVEDFFPNIRNPIKAESEVV